MITRSFLAAIAATVLPIGITTAQMPCFETNLGTNLGLSDDLVATAVPLGFNFPGPGGVNTSAISISSNGFVWLGSNNDHGCCNGFPFLFLPGQARLAPLWTNLDPGQPSATQGVFFRAVPGAPGAPARAVVTWANVREAQTNNVFTVQMQLDANGLIQFAYDARVTAAELWFVLIGITEGNSNPTGIALPQAIDFSALTGNPLSSPNNPTVLEHFPGLGATDIAGRVFQFAPLQNGYLVQDVQACTQATVQSYGTGCPLPASIYETFASGPTFDLANTSQLFVPNGLGGWLALPGPGLTPPGGQTLLLADDELSLPIPLGFPFTHPGGSTSSIQVGSNGFVWLSTGNTDTRCCDGDPIAFHIDAASVAGFWTDLDPESGGSITTQQDLANGAFHVTWTGVPDFVLGNPQTFQISLFANGFFALSYGTMGASGNEALVGYSPGSSVLVAPAVDLSTVPVSSGSGGLPLTLGTTPGALPSLGSVLPLTLTNVPAGSVLGLMVLSFSELPGIPLDAAGINGCRLFAGLDIVNVFALPSSLLAIPNNPSLIALQIFAQGGTLSPGVNPAGIALSNGLRLGIGI